MRSVFVALSHYMCALLFYDRQAFFNITYEENSSALAFVGQYNRFFFITEQESAFFTVNLQECGFSHWTNSVKCVG